MTRTLVIVRTHRADVSSLAMFDLLAEAGLDADVIFCVDERKEAADMGERPKVSYEKETLAQLGLYEHQNCGWRCGDYCYYVTRVARPNYDHYWLIEPDVRIHVDKLADFFTKFASSSADLLAAQYGPRTDLWGWTRTVTAGGLPAYGCLYPITRLSGQAIDALLKLRQAWSADSRMTTVLDWPNDEAFTASALTAAGFVCQDLNASTTCYTAQSFAVTAVVDYDVVLQSPPNGLIYHPVRDFGPWLEKAEKRIANSSFVSSVRGPTRADASYLAGVAQACLGHPVMSGAALVPLLLALDVWTNRRWATGQAFDNSEADSHQAKLCADKLRRRFGTSAQHGFKARVYLARANSNAVSAPSESDFETWGAMPIRSYPVHFAVPYAFDVTTSEVLSTLHVSTRDVLRAESPAAVQIKTARAVARLGFVALRRIEAQERPLECGLTIVFGSERMVAGAVAAACQAGGKTVVNIPGPLVQLLADTATRSAFFKLPLRQRSELLRWSVFSFFRLHAHGDIPQQVVLCLPSAASSMASALTNALRPAETLFVIDENTSDAAPAVTSTMPQPPVSNHPGNVINDPTPAGHTATHVDAAGALTILRTITSDQACDVSHSNITLSLPANKKLLC